MNFVSISIRKYIELYLKNNPEENEKDIKDNLLKALKDFKSGNKCGCGNDIWVIGSSVAGNGCFTCITGGTDSSEDFEIENALPKTLNTLKGTIKTMGYFDNDGNEFNPDLYPTPNLCLSCKKNENSKEDMICNLTRMDQLDEKEFKCFAYENKYSK